MSLRNILRNLVNAFSSKIYFEDLKEKENIFLYAGDVPRNKLYSKFIGLSLTQGNSNHIKHDATKKIPLEDSSVDIYQSEDVFEHIELQKLPSIISDIYRVLKPGGVFRLSLPDYGCDILRDRTQKDEEGQLLFDPDGGGDFANGKVINGGHVWFPVYKTVKDLLESSEFEDIQFFHYYDQNGDGITNPIDYSIGYVMRTPDNDARVKEPYRPLSIVVDCIK